MIKFYTNKELAQKFNVNLARWKRWSREFLPPDPLGGLQSGYARQFNPDEAFTVVLGGHLVGDLKFTIPDARRIVYDLQQWLVDHDFYFDFSGIAKSTKKPVLPVKNYHIVIIRNPNADHSDSRFSYVSRGILADESIDLHGEQVRQTRFTESSIGNGKDTADLNYSPSYRVLNISVLRNRFLSALQDNLPTD
jgi:hypothetical protein